LKAQTYLRNAQFSDEDNTIVWFCGTSTIAIVDLSNGAPRFINELVPDLGDGLAGIPLRAVAKNNGSQLLVSFVLDNMHSFAYYEDGMVEPDNHILSDIIPRSMVAC